MNTTAITPYTEPQGVTLVDIRLDAKRFPRVKNLSGQTATARLQQVVAMAYAYTGRPAEEVRIEMVAGALYAELIQDKKHLGTANITIEEVAHAVKDAILSAEGDVYINIAFLYKAVCNYATGEGHTAQEEAYRRTRAARQQAIAASPVGAMLNAYTSETLNNAKQ